MILFFCGIALLAALAPASPSAGRVSDVRVVARKKCLVKHTQITHDALFNKLSSTGMSQANPLYLQVITGCNHCALLGCRPECTESFQVIHYEEGQEYKPHLDAYDTSTDHGLNNCKRGGNRLITTLLYLSDVDAVRAPASADTPSCCCLPDC